MSCESEGPTQGPMREMSGGSCPTPAYAQSQVKAIQCGQGVDCTKQPEATKSPRPGVSELAAKQICDIENMVAREAERTNERFSDKLTTELIRAREIGQREGREDAQRLIDGVRQQNERLARVIANAKPQPVMFYDSTDQVIREREAQLAEAHTRLTAQEQMLQRQAETIVELQERNDWQAERLKECAKGLAEVQRRNDNQARHIEQYRAELRKPIARIYRRLGKPSLLSGITELEALCIESVTRMAEGLVVIVQ